jgi:hypothetical protein
VRDVNAAASRPSPGRALDDISDHLGQVLRHADELLDEWRRFGAAVRGQVDRETAAIGDAVATAVDGAVARSVAETAASVDRAVSQTMAERVGAQLQTLAAELARLEGRAKAASRAIADQRAGDRRLLWAVIAGIAVANVLLVILVLRKPVAVEVAPSAVPVVVPSRDEAAPRPLNAAGSNDGSATPAPVTGVDPTPPAVGPGSLRSPSGASPPPATAPGDSDARGARGIPTRSAEGKGEPTPGAHADSHGAPRRH